MTKRYHASSRPFKKNLLWLDRVEDAFKNGDKRKIEQTQQRIRYLRRIAEDTMTTYIISHGTSRQSEIGSVLGFCRTLEMCEMEIKKIYVISRFL